MKTEIVIHERLDGKARWNVLVDGEVVGQMYTKARARKFLTREVLPLLHGRTK